MFYLGKATVVKVRMIRTIHTEYLPCKVFLDEFSSPGRKVTSEGGLSHQSPIPRGHPLVPTDERSIGERKKKKIQTFGIHRLAN